MTYNIPAHESIRLAKMPIALSGDYYIYDAEPAIGIIYVINNFLSGHVRLRGRPNGSYPYKYLEMIDALFSKAEHTIEVCSGDIMSDRMHGLITVDLKNINATVNCDAQQLQDYFYDGEFDRWRCDPPYNDKTAREMYGCEMPSFSKLLKAGARVVKANSLLFLLCAQNYQICPPELKRIGLITITVVPNNEIRACNIYVRK